MSCVDCDCVLCLPTGSYLDPPMRKMGWGAFTNGAPCKTYGVHMGGNWAIRVVTMVPILANHIGAIWGRWAPLHPCGSHTVFAPLTPKWRPSGRTGISGNRPCGPHMCFASGTHLCQLGISWDAWVRYPEGLCNMCTWHTCGLSFLLFNVGYFT
jgi:hypothetical protein